MLSSTKTSTTTTAASQPREYQMKSNKQHKVSQGPYITSKGQLSTFVGGLPSLCTRDQLTQFMSQFGYVKEVYISKDMASNTHKGFAFVKFASVFLLEKLFGEHRFQGKLIEIKRSLQDYVCLHGLPVHTTEADIDDALRALGFSVVEILLGGKVSGVPLGTAGLKLSKQKHQEELANNTNFKILGHPVKAALRIQKRRDADYAGKGLESVAPFKQRSSIDVLPLNTASMGLDAVQTSMFRNDASPLFSCSSSKLDNYEDFETEWPAPKSSLRKKSEALHLMRDQLLSQSIPFEEPIGREFLSGYIGSPFLIHSSVSQVNTTPAAFLAYDLANSLTSFNPTSVGFGYQPYALLGNLQEGLAGNMMLPNFEPKSASQHFLTQVVRIGSQYSCDRAEESAFEAEVSRKELIISFYVFPGYL
jgi:RNA recognition motif. (a.k.a. RRM, RBD, or RNP domain)